MAATKTTRKSKRSVYDAKQTPVFVRARYDIAQTTDENEKLWTGADALSAAQANNPTVRATIRNRARYEVANNSYACGIVRSITNDTVGPEIQLQLGDTEKAQQIEQDFMDWARAVRLWRKLRTMRRAKCVDGEVFALMVTNRLVQNDIKLDLRLLECDMVESWYTVFKPDEIDGIKFDDSGNPIQYRVLKQHPGDYRDIKLTTAGDWVAARYVCHYFTEERPGQVRGVSEIFPALSLFGQLRKYTAAVIECASRAAEITGVMQTDLVPDSLAAELADPVTVIDAQRNAIISMPEGWKLAQMKAEQPTTTYQMFKNEIIKEMARCINMPANVAQGDSSGYNYASGRLDHQSYDRAVEVERAELVELVLDRVYGEWLAEYATRKSLSTEEIMLARSHEWHFAGRGHVDPNKEASADDTRFRNMSLTKSAYYAKQGKDWKREQQQWIRERIIAEQMWNEARADAGLPSAPYPASETAAMPEADEDDDEPVEQKENDEE